MKRGVLDVEAWLGWLEIKSRRRGVERWACCPLHGEREPSLQIRDDPEGDGSGLWRCFGCGENGNAAQLTARLVGVDVGTALDMMHERRFFGEPPPLPMRISFEPAPCKSRFVMPEGVRFADLDQWVTPARRFVESRGITAAQVARWRIGYGEQGKLVGRVVVPVHDGDGVLRGYSARDYVGHEKRYVEPSTVDGYEPGYVWGESWWPPLARRERVVVCEGSLNGLAIERVLPMLEVDVAVAAVRGSHLDHRQALRLGGFAHVIVASDPDKAGEKLWRALHGALARWVRVSRVELPQGADANDVERRDARALAMLIERVL